jgi:hypothetical protein
MQKVNGSQKSAAPRLEQFKAEIVAKAKEIFLKRQETKEPGDAFSDWLQAEKMVKEKYKL